MTKIKQSSLPIFGLPHVPAVIHNLNKSLVPLNDAERTLVRATLHEWAVSNNDELLQELWHADYTEGTPPVPPEEFFSNPYYIGEFGKSIYPCWLEDLCYVCDPKNNIEEWGMVGAQRTGKSVAALAAQKYKMYQLSKLKNPHGYYGFPKLASINFGFVTLDKAKAQGELYDRFVTLLEQSPYFRSRFPSRKRKGMLTAGRRSQSYEANEDEFAAFQLEFPNKINVVAGSKLAHLVSIDLISCILDELNWRKKKTVRPEEDPNSAGHVYEQVRTRIRGTFSRVGAVPGLICSISSKQTTSDFMEEVIARMRRESNRCHVSDYALWEAKPDRQRSGKTFFVLVGNTNESSKILTPEEHPLYDLNSPLMLEVPEEYRPEFELNLVTALRDIGGVSINREMLLFDNPSIIEQCTDHNRVSPFNVTEIELAVLDKNRQNFIHEALNLGAISRFDGTVRRPLFHPSRPRFIHIDLAKNRDCAGFSMGCSYDSIFVNARTPEGIATQMRVPKIWVDIIIRIRAAAGDQIDFEKIRHFVGYLRRIGFRIAQVSFDQYQSTDSMQLLSKQGFKTQYISVDRSDNNYQDLRMSYAQQRISCYPYPPLADELRQLIWYPNQKKVDHPDMAWGGGPGSKDVADAVAGMHTAVIQGISKSQTSIVDAPPELTDQETEDLVTNVFRSLHGNVNLDILSDRVRENQGADTTFQTRDYKRKPTI